jgi:hypothetical protein
MDAIDKIKLLPLGHRKVIKDARKVELAKFPYAVWYKVQPDQRVVIGYLHGAGDRVLARELASNAIEIPKPEPD